MTGVMSENTFDVFDTETIDNGITCISSNLGSKMQI